MAAAPLRHPGRAVGRQRHPRPGRPGDGAAGRRARRLVRGDLPGARVGRARTGPCYVTGTPIRDIVAIDREARPGRGWTSRRTSGSCSIFGGSQAVRRFNAAVAEALPRLVERVTVIHVTGDDGYAAALAGREALPAAVRAALPAVPVPARRDAGRAGHRRPRRRAGRVVDAGRGDRARPADGRRPVPARGRPPAGERGAAWSRPAPPG